jgi:RND superfamily putative drug exporter
VLVTWTVLFLAALPFAARQSENLTGGGFAVPGSQSDAVQASLERDFDAAQRPKLGVVLIARKGATAADQRAALSRLRAAAARVAHSMD